MFDVRSDNLFDVFGIEAIEKEIDTVGGVEGERSKVIFAFQLEEFEDFLAGGLDELVGFFAPGIFDAFSAGVVFVVVVI